MMESTTGAIPGDGYSRLGRWARLIWRGLWRLLLLALLVAVAWALSNWRDGAQPTRPAALQPWPAAVADADNSLFDLLALRAEPAAPLRETGRQMWRQMQVPAQAGGGAARSPAQGSLLPALNAQALGCQTFGADCLQAWLQDPVALRQRRAAHALLGSRCDALLAGQVLFEEPVGPDLVAGPVAPFATAMAACSTWALSGVMQAWSEGRRDEALGLLVAHEQLLSRWRTGSRSLLSHLVVSTWTRHHLRAVAMLGLRSPAMAARLQQALPDPRSLDEAGWAWVPHENAFQEQLIHQVKASCSAQSDGAPVVTDGATHCWMPSFWLPNATEDLGHQRWLKFLAQRGDGVQAAAEAAVVRHKQAPDSGLWATLYWRNTMGHLLFEVSKDAHDSYVVRFADALLHRDVVAWFLDAQSRSAAALNPGTAEAPARWRERWSADHQAGRLSVRSYAADLAVGDLDRAAYGIELVKATTVD